MTTKQLKDIIDAPPVHRTPFFLPLCQLACEIAGFGDDLNAPADEGKRPLNFDYNIVDEIRAQAHRVRAALTAKPAAPAPVVAAVPPAAPPAAPAPVVAAVPPAAPPADPPAKSAKKGATDPQ